MRFHLAFLPRSRARCQRHSSKTLTHSSVQSLTVVDLAPGEQGKVINFLPGLSVERETRLRAYGLATGVQLRVTQHVPVTIIEVDELELALEWGLASRIEVEKED